MFFDEATSALDMDTEFAIMQSIHVRLVVVVRTSVGVIVVDYFVFRMYRGIAPRSLSHIVIDGKCNDYTLVSVLIVLMLLSRLGLSTIVDSDKIIVLNAEGSVAEQVFFWSTSESDTNSTFDVCCSVGNARRTDRATRRLLSHVVAPE
jgi:hypothetical protein